MALFLQEHGYRASALVGGFNAWRDAGLPLTAIPQFNQEVDPLAQASAGKIQIKT